MRRLRLPAAFLLLLGLFLALGGHDLLMALDDHHHHHGDATTTLAQASPGRLRAELEPTQPPGAAAVALVQEPVLAPPPTAQADPDEGGHPPPRRPVGLPTGLRAPPSFS